MIAYLYEPFTYAYMTNAMWVSALVGGVCAFLSAYLMLKGWSLIGDALSHSIVPGVALTYMLGLPFVIGAFFSGGLAAWKYTYTYTRTHVHGNTHVYMCVMHARAVCNSAILYTSCTHAMHDACIWYNDVTQLCVYLRVVVVQPVYGVFVQHQSMPHINVMRVCCYAWLQPYVHTRCT